MFRHILIPSDHSEAGMHAVERGVDLAKALGAKLTILNVQQPFHTFSLSPEMLTETPDEHRRALRARTDIDLRRAERSASEAGVEWQTIEAEHDHLGEAVVQTAKARGCDLVVMPAHERHGLMGTTSLDGETVRLLRHSRLPVLVLH
jgi:nucleotide-binding universal stress UspA family protein